MSQNTQNSTAFIEAQQYSSFILTNLYDGLLPGQFYRNVTDFQEGSTLNIKSIGSATIQDVSEETPLVYNPIDTGTITMTISEYEGDAWSVSDSLREDGSQVEQLMAARAAEATRLLQESFETKFLAACNNIQTNSAANNVNGFAHRIVSAETNDIISLSHLSDMKLAFDKANVPAGGRVLIVDPVVGSTLERLVGITKDVTAFGQMILEQGFAREHQFIMNIFGWDIITSNRLYKGSIGDGTETSASGVANVALSLADDNHKAIMAAWRRMPSTEGERNMGKQRDEFQVTARYGFGNARADTIGIIGTSATAVA
jgi:hypothetical protein